MVGTNFGHYHIVDSLGKGGMGEVYAAEDTRLERRVALKVLSREVAMDAGRRERFEREARAVAALNHPNIVTIYSVEEADGIPFLTLELIEGRTLDALMPPGGLPIDRLLAYAIPLTDAVGAAHQRGITHRDLKPGNVMVGADGRVKVLDFGLAKLKDSVASLSASLPTQELTGEGRIVGTVAYMSPEQAEGKPVDPRSDVFSLGVLLFEMATSQRPFRGDNQVSLLSAIIKDTPSSLSDLKSDLPRDFARIVKRCLAKDPEDRYQTAKDLRNDLRALKEDLASGTAPAAVSSVQALPVPRAAGKRRMWMAAGGIAAALGLGGAAVVYWSGHDVRLGTDSVAAVPFATVELSRLTTTGAAGLAAISDDGRYVAYVATEAGKSGLWLRQVATTSNVAVVPPAAAQFHGVTFSPNGSHLYYSFYPTGEVFGRLWQVAVLGGNTRSVLDDVDGGISFDPSGKRFATVRGIAASPRATALVVVDTDGSNVRQLMTRKAPDNFRTQSVSWSPDGQSIAALADNGEARLVEVLLVDAATGQHRVLGEHRWRNATHLAWLPDGQSLLVTAQADAGDAAADQIWVLPVTGGEPRRITNDLSGYAGLSVTADGKSFVSVRRELRSRVWIVDDTGNAQVVSTGAGADDGVNGLDWTADGRLLYTSASSGNLDIWIMDADGRTRVQLTSEKGQDSSPTMSSDGRRIVFVSERGGSRGLWTMGLDGSEQRRVGTVTVAPNPTLSADDKWIYYSDTGGRCFRIGIDGGEPQPIQAATSGGAARPLPERFHEPASSPDGHRLVGHYYAADVKGERMAVVPLDGGPPTLFPNVPIRAQWARDGKSLLFLVTQGGGANLWRQPIAGGPPTQLSRFSDEQIFGISDAPDQKRFAIVRGTRVSDVVLISERK